MIKYSGFIVIFFSFFSQIAYAENHAFTKVSACGKIFDNEPLGFCDKSHQTTFKDSLERKKINFNRHYILLPIDEDAYTKSIVVLDAKSGVAYPLNYTYEGFVDKYKQLPTGKPVQVIFNKRSDMIFIKGTQVGNNNIIPNRTFKIRFDGKNFISE